jgi:F0F1-type ATP synthase beta subunit
MRISESTDFYEELKELDLQSSGKKAATKLSAQHAPPGKRDRVAPNDGSLSDPV